MVARIVKAALAAGLALLAPAGCGSGPSESGCRAALEQQWREALGNPTTVQPGTEPDACKGLPDAVVQRLWYEAGNGAVK